MTTPTVLFIPDRFMDHRMWVDIPDRLSGRAEAIHFDQHADIPWTASNAEFLDAARRLAGDGGFDVVSAAGHAARFAFALAETGSAKGLVFFGPSIDTVPDDAGIDIDIDPAEIGEMLKSLEPIVSAVASEPDTGAQRDMLLQVLRATAEPDADPADLDLAGAMLGDHSEDFFAVLRSVAAAAAGQPEPDPDWIRNPWINRLPGLTVPVTAVGSGFSVEAIARRATDAEIIEAAGGGLLLAPETGRAQAADAIARMLDRVG
jgi:hypothetical protein